MHVCGHFGFMIIHTQKMNRGKIKYNVDIKTYHKAELKIEVRKRSKTT